MGSHHQRKISALITTSQISGSHACRPTIRHFPRTSSVMNKSICHADEKLSSRIFFGSAQAGSAAFLRRHGLVFCKLMVCLRGARGGLHNHDDFFVMWG